MERHSGKKREENLIGMRRPPSQDFGWRGRKTDVTNARTYSMPVSPTNAR